MKTSVEIQGKMQEFVWGPVKAVHEIGLYSIVEAHPQIFKGCAGTGRYDMKKTTFHPYVNGECTSCAYNTLDEALAASIAFRYEGHSHRADIYFLAALKQVGEKQS